MIAREAFAHGVAALRKADVPGAERDVRALLAAAMGVPRDRLTLHLGDEVSQSASAAFNDMLAARQARKPVAQILGVRLFYGRDFQVTPDVLDPRPETETLVAHALERRFSRVLDLGTGTGAIAITLLAERGDAKGVATDLSPAALAVAAANAKALGVADRLTLVEAYWMPPAPGQFDLIVSNPPYIAQSEMADLAPEVRDHEPALALTDGGDGLSAYRAITAAAPSALVPGGALMVEIGAGQGAAVSALFTAGGLGDIGIVQDLDGRDRVVCGYTPG